MVCLTNPHPALRLQGRRDECATLERLTSLARSGQSQVLVLRGEAGIGKTALLDFLLERTSGFSTARVAGVEREMELAFATLQQLCAPLLEYLDRLPAPQRDALDIAFGRRAGAAPDRFLVGLAVLTLIGAATESRPLIFVVDDAQWIDRVSVQTLAFVARRLIAEPVAMIRGARRPGQRRRRVDGATGADRRRAQDRRCPGVAGFDHPGPAGQPGPRSHRGGDARQSAGTAGIA